MACELPEAVSSYDVEGGFGSRRLPNPPSTEEVKRATAGGEVT